MTLLILAQKVKEEKKINSLVLLILLLISIFLHINSIPSAYPSFKACCEGMSVRGMAFQWRKRMDQWIKETTPSKTWGKTRRDGWEEAITHMPHASASLSLFFHSSLFHSCIQLLQPLPDWHEQNCPSVLQMVQLLLYSCLLSHRFCINPACLGHKAQRLILSTLP